MKGLPPSLTFKRGSNETKGRFAKPRLTATEHLEQAAVMTWARLHEGRYPALRLLFAIPNGGHRSKTTAGLLKAEGVKPGVCDLFLSVARAGHHGLYIEMKALDGCLRAEQRAFMDAVKAEGYAADVCKGAEAAIETLKAYLGIKTV